MTLHFYQRVKYDQYEAKNVQLQGLMKRTAKEMPAIGIWSITYHDAPSNPVSFKRPITDDFSLENAQRNVAARWISSLLAMSVTT